jgi:hypothetical protein
MSRTVIKSKCPKISVGNPKKKKVKHRGTEAQRHRGTEARRGKREENERRNLALAKGFEN